ncbi:MAG: ester cyclase [Kiritimatiellae bacterium]|nr:ester cyclase [Kiritimatiellia bacterium]
MIKHVLTTIAVAAFAAGAVATPVFHDFDVREEFSENPFTAFTGRGMLLCAGNAGESNAMTIGWGGFGTLWGRNDAVTVYVAESRHTKKFMDAATHFTVMEFDKDAQAKILAYMGHNSGRNGDKAAALGLHTAWTENGTPYYEEAQTVYECELMYSAPFDKAGMRDVPKALYANFPAGVHTMYIGRIVRAFRRDTPAKTVAQDAIERNKAAMRLFEKCINANDLELGRRLISEKAAFATPVSPEPLYGAEGYLSVVSLMRASFPDVQWRLEDMVADENTVAVRWTCSGTFTGEAPFAGIEPNGRKFSTSVMNFYSFDADGKIVDDTAATGIAGILQGIGAAK